MSKAKTPDHTSQKGVEEDPYQRYLEQIRLIPTPKCCKEAQEYPGIVFIDRGHDRDVLLSWYLSIYPLKLKLAHGIEYFSNIPEPKFCPYCGAALPKMQQQMDPSRKVHYSSNGHHCDVCGQRNHSCSCDPAGSDYVPIEPVLLTITAQAAGPIASSQKGGKVIFDTGKGRKEPHTLQLPAGDIEFQLGGATVMSFCSDGDIFVRGELVESNKEVVDSFKEWLRTAHSSFEKVDGDLQAAKIMGP